MFKRIGEVILSYIQAVYEVVGAILIFAVYVYPAFICYVVVFVILGFLLPLDMTCIYILVFLITAPVTRFFLKKHSPLELFPLTADERNGKENRDET